MVLRYCAMLLAVSLVSGDLYLHVPRGSNNRLNERSANRNNANRLFDSQNNNRGGYNVGDLTDQPSGNDASQQYSMKYFQSSSLSASDSGESGESDSAGESYLTIEWTNQHGCGGNEDSDPHKLNCNLVLQYMCQDDSDTATGPEANKHFTLRNGVNTQTNNYQKPSKNENQQTARNRRSNQPQLNRGLHEGWEWYDKCYVRERNRGLFTADQILRNNGLGYSSAIYTRQNPNGNRRGYECPEERDYYPYWHPTPWKDIAVLTDNITHCQSYQAESFNVQPYHECIERWSDGSRKWTSRWNNEEECTENGGTWTELHNFLEKDPGPRRQSQCEGKSGDGVNYVWGVPYDSTDGRTPECLISLPPPQCSQAPWSRSNHLGNGREGVASTYTWTLPHFQTDTAQRCVFRMRYNISTDDYDPFNTNSSHNQDSAQMVQSPVQQNPYVEVGVDTPLRLAINTAQFGRTFQDRSHVFILRERPTGLNNPRIFNLNVRGKRGNIVQTYPAVEYDFAPNTLEVTTDDLVHFQWTGSNTHNNGNPAGDGQAGDAGEGRAGTDRSNVVQSRSLGENYPLPYENTTMWSGSEAVWIYHGEDVTKEDVALSMASAGYYMCKSLVGCPRRSESADVKALLNNQLNNAPASYEGVMLRFTTPATYAYICTRNNNFTNRSQKAAIIVK